MPLAPPQGPDSDAPAVHKNVDPSRRQGMIAVVERAPRPWPFDWAVWSGALFGAASTAFAVFAGRYVPYIDWSAHLGLISVLAHGGQTGALEFYERSWAPSPYLLFYAASAILGQLVSVDVAAKLVLVATAALLTFASASLAEATGRSPRLGLIGPLALFGMSLGWGFGSFVVATPFFVLALAAFERFLSAVEPRDRRRRVLVLGVVLGLLFLAHGLLFLVCGLLIGLRAIGWSVLLVIRGRPNRESLTPVAGLAAATTLPIALALPSVIALLHRPTVEAGTEQVTTLVDMTPVREHLASFGGDLLQRGSEMQERVMLAGGGLLALWLLWSMVRPNRQRAGVPRMGLEFYAISVSAIYLFGPVAVNWPSSIWLVYPRFGIIAALLVMLLPRCDLQGPLGTPLALAALGLVGWNNAINARLIREFSAWAAPYDGVRAAIPHGSRVLALTLPSGNDPPMEHHTIGSLYDYLMVDGSAYVAYLFDKPELPVHNRRDVKLRAPFWTSPWAYDPSTHGRDFDYLVLRGSGLVERTEQAGLHERVKAVGPWVIFQTKNPRSVAEIRQAPP